MEITKKTIKADTVVDKQENELSQEGLPPGCTLISHRTYPYGIEVLNSFSRIEDFIAFAEKTFKNSMNPENLTIPNPTVEDN